MTCKRCIPIVAIRWLSSLINRSKVTISITIGIRIKLNCQPKRYNTISGAMPMMTMHVDEHAQSVSQLFHGPAPRSPLHRLSIRLRRSRSNTRTEYSLPGATQLSQEVASEVNLSQHAAADRLEERSAATPRRAVWIGGAESVLGRGVQAAGIPVRYRVPKTVQFHFYNRVQV